MKILLIFLLIIGANYLNAQSTEASKPFVIDTVKTSGRKAVLYSDKTWMYEEDINFDGVLNKPLHDYMNRDSNIVYKSYWNNDICYITDNDMANMKDTAWLTVLDSLHPHFAIPVPGILTSGFKYRSGRWHKGVDLDLDVGDTIRAAFSGKVRYAKYNQSGYGNLIIIRHYNGLETYYAHQSKLLVAPNDYVEAGQVIGLGGKTGRAYGAHLHFEVRFYDVAFNPEKIFDFAKKEIRDCNLLLSKKDFRYGKYASSSSSNRSSVAELRSRPPRTSSSSSSSSDSGGKTYHTIRKDDSLWKISRKYGTTVDALCKLNGISKSTILKIGRKLRVK